MDPFQSFRRISLDISNPHEWPEPERTALDDALDMLDEYRMERITADEMAGHTATLDREEELMESACKLLEGWKPWEDLSSHIKRQRSKRK